MPCHRVSAAAAALAACFVLLFSCLISAEHIEFDVWHRLGSDANSQWKPAGMLSGEVDTGALVDAAAAALRGGGGRISPPPKAASPVLTLFRDEKNGAITVEEANRAAERGQGYSIKLKRKLDRSATKKKTKTKNAALFTSAPPHCAAAALSGALPLKLDGTLPRSTPRGGGGGGIRVTGVSFDFYGGPCKGGGGGGPAGTKAQAQQRVPLWLPAAAPPLLPPPPPPAAAKKAAAAAALAQAQAEAARRRAAGDGEGGGAEGAGAPPPPPEDNRTWLQKNWVYALPMLMMAMNVMNAAAGPPPQQQRRPGAGAGAGTAAAGAVAAGAAAAAAGGGGGVASLD